VAKSLRPFTGNKVSIMDSNTHHRLRQTAPCQISRERVRNHRVGCPSVSALETLTNAFLTLPE
jgi:hypothetical protein